MDLKAKLTELAASSLLHPDQFLVDVVASSKNFSKITVIIDGDNGITIDDCSKISRAISEKLDEENFGTGHYLLEVTTPGLDQPLKLERQYRKNTGRGLKVHLKDKSIVQGKLTTCDENGIELSIEKREGKKLTEIPTTINYNQIEKAFVMISFK
jgi:ribosome maturation factor RimP